MAPWRDGRDHRQRERPARCSGARAALAWLAGTTVVLLATALRNAWDLATWIVAHRNDRRRAEGQGSPTGETKT